MPPVRRAASESNRIVILRAQAISGFFNTTGTQQFSRPAAERGAGSTASPSEAKLEDECVLVSLATLYHPEPDMPLVAAKAMRVGPADGSALDPLYLR